MTECAVNKPYIDSFYVSGQYNRCQGLRTWRNDVGTKNDSMYYLDMH